MLLIHLFFNKNINDLKITLDMSWYFHDEKSFGKISVFVFILELKQEVNFLSI